MSVKETHLGMDFFCLKGMQIGKNPGNIMHQSCFFTGFMIKAHELHISGFGLEGGLPLGPEEVGRKIGLTPEEVLSRETAALAKLRSN